MAENTTKNVTFVMMLMDEHPDRFLLVRNVNEYSTHYLGADGMWVAWPEDDDDLAETFEFLKDNPTHLPQFDLGLAEDINEGLEDDIDS